MAKPDHGLSVVTVDARTGFYNNEQKLEKEVLEPFLIILFILNVACLENRQTREP